MYFMFNVIFFYVPSGWIFLNYVLPLACWHEYSILQACVLENLMSRFPEHKALHYRLIEKLNKEWFSLSIMTLYHINVLLVPMKYNGLAILVCFITVVF